MDDFLSLFPLNHPVTWYEYMGTALYHPRLGYYSRRVPMGEEGDYTTAPEISPLFGECLAFWAMQRMLHELSSDSSKPKIHLIELGPGKATLMSDLLRVITGLNPSMVSQLQVHLIEASKPLQIIQQETLKPWMEELSIQWHSDWSTVPPGAAVIVANEFFDALPIRQWVRVDQQWFEVGVIRRSDVQGLANTHDSTLAWARIMPSLTSKMMLDGLLGKANKGDIPNDVVVEYSPMGSSWVKNIADHLRFYGGAAIIIDYGHWQHPWHSTIQAIRQHQTVLPFEYPGTCDLSAHVHFGWMRDECVRYGLGIDIQTTQGDFLKSMGIEDLMKRYIKKQVGVLENSNNQRLQSGYERLVEGDKMGDLFKVLAVSSQNKGSTT